MVHVDLDDGVAIVTLDDPDRRNALSSAMVDELIDVVQRLDGDDSVGALVVTGSNGVFCSGGDVGNLLRLVAQGGGDVADIRASYRGSLEFRDSSLPTVAAVNGPSIGAGMNLALACDVRVTCPSARFESRFAQIGLHPGGAHVWMLDRLTGPQTTAALVAFGERVDGRRAVDIGLAWKCVPYDEVVGAAVALAKRAAAVPRDLMTKIKRTMHESPWHPQFDAAISVELERQAWSFTRGYLSDHITRS
jgi:enoyl-CoA hydratase